NHLQRCMQSTPDNLAPPTAATQPARWRIVLLCAILGAVAGLLGGVLDRSQPLTFGHDLISSYTAGRMLLDGKGGSLYDASACESAGRSVMTDANLSGNPHHVRWLNPGY